jgi:hypothetical protein
VSQFGVSAGQSLGQHLVLASTVKLLRGGVAASSAGARNPLESAEDADASSDTHADLDIGVIAAARSVRIGFSVRNLSEPQFGSGELAMKLKRKARVGAAALMGPHGVLDGLVVASDLDLTKTAAVDGEVRHVAGGAEAWLLRRHVGLRGGLSGNTVGERRAAWSYGASVAPTTGFYIEGARTVGRDDSLRAWTITLRVTF